MKTKTRALLLATGLLAGLFGSAAVAQSETTLRVMGYSRTLGFMKPHWQTVIDNFEAANPGVKIEMVDTPWPELLQQITTSILGGNPPDVFQMAAVWTPQLHAIGGLQPVAEYFSADELEKFGSLDSVTYAGEVVGIPWLPGPIHMIYNRNLLKEAGLDPNAPPKTWPAFTEAVKKVCALPDKNGQKVYGVALRTTRVANSVQWALPVVYGHGGDIVDADGKPDVTNKGFQQGFAWFHDIISSGCAANGSSNNDTRALFTQGRAAFLFDGPWARGYIGKLSDGKLKVDPAGDVWNAPFPAGPDGKVRQIANHMLLGISKSSKNKDAAAEFIRFVLTDPNTVQSFFEGTKLLATGRMDILTQGPISEDQWAQVFVSTLDMSNPVPIRHPKSNAILDSLAPVLQKVIKGEEPAQALQDAQREIDRLAR